MSTPSEPVYATAIPLSEQPLPVKRDLTRNALPSFTTASRLMLRDDQEEALLKQGFTLGLARAMAKNNHIFPQRIWVVDNSGSMQKVDGHRILDNGSSRVQTVSCTRWEEIRECAVTHIQLSSLLEVPTQFRLLNNPGAKIGPQKFTCGSIRGDQYEAINIVQNVSPYGGTPLRMHIEEIYGHVTSLAPELARTGARVVIVIATDGLPTNELAIGGEAEKERFVQSLRLLEGLPVWVVIRLCTDEEDVVDFYNELDEQLELSLEVLDDFQAEALEVYEHNPWLNYALPLHRCREMGFYHRVFDLIDERPLTKNEIREFMQLLLGDEHFDGICDPDVDWMGFSNAMEVLVRQEDRQWDPVKKQMRQWINMTSLNRIYGRSETGCACNVM